jgi:hydroxyethylthiazole kinase-like uncharacterized protein yjeF
VTIPPDWTDAETAACLRFPGPGDDKYSRGVLGVLTGSEEYPGAAVLSVEAAARTGAGLIRYLGSATPTMLVLQRRPEVVTMPGRVQAWLIGSGIPTDELRAAIATDAMRSALDEGMPTVLDAGGLDMLALACGPLIITPHAGELASLLRVGGAPPIARSEIAADPHRWAVHAAARFGVTVLLKGHTTVVASPEGESRQVTALSSWAATAGSGDVLGGILGTLLAGASTEIMAGSMSLIRLGAAAAQLHQAAVHAASADGPVTALDIAEAVPGIIGGLRRG